ncbi:phosphotransferase [Nocardia panacis]|nr:phosphotransferase [Nocardia panacis]
MRAWTPVGGFSHGMAARLEFANGRRVFAKAIDVADELAGMYRVESRTAARLPKDVPAPRVLFDLEHAGWLVTVFEDVAGRHPRFDRPGELAAALAAVAQLAQVLNPCPLEGIPTIAESYGAVFGRWLAFAESDAPADLDVWAVRNLTRLAELEGEWSTRTMGNTLLHTDLRPDNMLRRADGTVVVVDWAWPCRGAAWVDLVSLGPSIAACGVDPDPILAEHPVTRAIDPRAVDAYLCALVGYWAHSSRMPVPSRSPRLREHHANAYRVSRDWLRRRVGWS